MDTDTVVSDFGEAVMADEPKDRRNWKGGIQRRKDWPRNADGHYLPQDPEDNKSSKKAKEKTQAKEVAKVAGRLSSVRRPKAVGTMEDDVDYKRLVRLAKSKSTPKNVKVQALRTIMEYRYGRPKTTEEDVGQRFRVVVYQSQAERRTLKTLEREAKRLVGAGRGFQVEDDRAWERAE